MSEETYQYEHGLDIPISSPVSRIVSLVPSITESLFDVQLGNRLVGITDYCSRPPEKVADLPRIGGTRDVRIEEILALEPELVFANQEDNTPAAIEALQTAGTPVWITNPQTVPDVFNLLWNIMYVFEETSMVPRVRLIEYTYDWVSGSVKAQGGVCCRVFVPIWFNPLVTITADTYTHNLLSVCGGQNVFANYSAQNSVDKPSPPSDRIGPGDRFPQISIDDVVAAQPEVILLPDEPFPFDETHLAQFTALDIPAAHNQRIHRIDGSLLTWPGTRVGYALNELPPLFCPLEED